MEEKKIHKIDFIRMGGIVREARQNIGMTQEQLSELVDVTPAFIGHIERGERSVSLNTLFSIAENLHISYDYLLNENKSVSNSESITTAFNTLIQDKSPKTQEAVLDIVRTALKHF